MTDDEHIKLVEVGDKFWEDFSKLIADALNKLPESLHGEAMYYLQDKTSVFGSNYEKYMQRDNPAEESILP